PEYLDYHAGVFQPTGFDASVVQWVLIVGYTDEYWIVKNSLGHSWGAQGYMYLARGANFLGVGNFIYALMPGAASAGSCSLPNGSCVETGAGGCADANGTFGGLGTFCATPCPLVTTAHAPMLSGAAIGGLVLLLALVGLAQLFRTQRGVDRC